MRIWIGFAAALLGTLLDGTEVRAEARSGLITEPEMPFVASAPTIEISQGSGQVRISFTGTLQWAGSVDGPWTDALDATNPFIDEADGERKFYRTRGPESIFSSQAVVALTVQGPLQAYFELAFAGMPDGIFPPVREKPYFDGMLKLANLELPVTLRVRGNSSLQECPFPKLKFKVSKEARAGTPFFDAREIKIGTHCAEGGRGSIGRLRDQRATFREALVYETMELLGFIAPRVRRAEIEYRDSSPTNGTSEVGWQVSRHALILDDVEVMAERLGGRALDDEEIEKLEHANFDEQLVTDLWLFHVLLGNWDYVLPTDGRGLWNTDVIELADGELLPVAGDFDLASWVTEEVRLSAPWDYHPELADIDRQARYETEEIQKRAGSEKFNAAKDRFMPKRPAIEAQINTALIDEVGRTNALRHVTAFFAALAAVKQ